MSIRWLGLAVAAVIMGIGLPIGWYVLATGTPPERMEGFYEKGGIYVYLVEREREIPSIASLKAKLTDDGWIYIGPTLPAGREKAPYSEIAIDAWRDRFAILSLCAEKWAREDKSYASVEEAIRAVKRSESMIRASSSGVGEGKILWADIVRT